MRIDMSKIEGRSLKNGGHNGPDDGMCVMEAVSYIAGEPWSDHPQCVSPAITSFMVNWNDALRSDDERDRLLKPLIPEIVGTRTNDADEQTRAFMAMDWLTRVWVPEWLDLVPSCKDAAAKLRAMHEVSGIDGLRANTVVVREAGKAAAAARDAARDAARAAARDAARAAARAAARDAAWDAARDAAWDAAWAAARDAAWAAARAAARDAAWAAARDAAWAAAWDAAWAALAPTVEKLQSSAQDLVRRMAAVGRSDA